MRGRLCLFGGLAVLLSLPAPLHGLQLSVSSVSGSPGDKVSIAISGDGGPAVLMLTASLVLDPALATPVTGAFGMASGRALGTAAAAGSQLYCVGEDGTLAIALMASGAGFIPQGPLVEVDVIIAPSAAPGAYPLIVDGAAVGDASGGYADPTVVPGTLTVLSSSDPRTPPQAAYGDVDADGSVTVRDVLLMLRAAAGMVQLSPDETKRGDVAPLRSEGFGDGKVTVQDVLRVLKRMVGLEPDTWPEGTPEEPPPSSSVTLGPEGGTLTSGDGRLQLQVPAGALAAPTTLSVQPIENTAPLGARPTLSDRRDWSSRSR